MEYSVRQARRPLSQRQDAVHRHWLYKSPDSSPAQSQILNDHVECQVMMYCTSAFYFFFMGLYSSCLHAPMPSHSAVANASRNRTSRNQTGSQPTSYDLISRLEPSMLSGCSRPMRARIVGATSPSTPSVFFRLHDSGALAITKGTLLRVCDVLGVPSSVSISSAFLACC